MSELNKNRCAVMLPSGPHFERLFNEVLERAILETGLTPLRLYQNPRNPTPINVFVEEIEQTSALFADISENIPEIWLAVGCAVSLGMPLCLISSKLESSLPLGIQYLPLIPYPTDAFPSDYVHLQQNITAQLLAILPQVNIAKPVSQSQSQASVTSSVLPPPTPSDDLASYEVMALTIIDLKGSGAGLSPRDLGLEMRARDSAHLTSHAMNALKRRRFIERKPVQINDGNELHISENLFLTHEGEDWLTRHGRRSTAHRSRTRARGQFLGGK